MSLFDYHRRRVLSFKYAFSGISAAFLEEPNLKFHFFMTFVVILLGLILNISQEDWIFIIILIGLVISVELTNTAIETVVDSFTTAEHPQAKLAKDVSAGAVLIISIFAALAGLIIFIPYIWKFSL